MLNRIKVFSVFNHSIEAVWLSIFSVTKLEQVVNDALKFSTVTYYIKGQL